MLIEVIDKQRHVFETLAQRWQLKRNHVQTIKQVSAKVSVLDLDVETFVCRGDEAYVHRDRRPASDRLKALLFEDAQHLRLHLRTHVAHFIEKDRRAVRKFKLALLRSSRACERSFDVAE